MPNRSGHTLNAGLQVSAGFLADGITPTTNPALMVWSQLTDDNRQPIKLNYEVIEKTYRMADGTLRRYVIARKHKITSSWSSVWSKSSMSSDYNLTDKKGYAGAWMRSFYEANVFNPIYVRVTAASVNTATPTPNLNLFIPTETTTSPYNSADTYVPAFNSNESQNTTYNVFMTSFDYEVVKRNKEFDLVNISIEFTEI